MAVLLLCSMVICATPLWGQDTGTSYENENETLRYENENGNVNGNGNVNKTTRC